VEHASDQCPHIARFCSAIAQVVYVVARVLWATLCSAESTLLTGCQHGSCAAPSRVKDVLLYFRVKFALGRVRAAHGFDEHCAVRYTHVP
jgi:hypothetical protein